MNADGDGVLGIESYYNDTLKGTAGRVVGMKNAWGYDLPNGTYEAAYDAEDGNGLAVSYTHLVDANTGSLGQGVSIAGGMALAAKYKGESHRVFVITGDGESQEGLVWEAAMSAAHYKPVSYTHLDVYKRQHLVMEYAWPSPPSTR